MTAAVLIFACVALCAIILGVQRARRRARRETEVERSELHQTIYNALEDWLQVLTICKVMVEERVATHEGLQAAFIALPSYDEAKIKAVVSCLLRSRRVRQVIARYMVAGTGVPVGQAERSLMGWARFRDEFRESAA